MAFSYQKSLKTALKSSWTILKLIVPIYILADVLFYYNLLAHITFVFKPLVALLDLPPEAALAIVSGLFLNIYAAIAFAAPLGLSAKEWTVLAVFFRNRSRAYCRDGDHETIGTFKGLLHWTAFRSRTSRWWACIQVSTKLV
ncbi:MAG: hypothetical protein LRY52_07920 [Sulfurospirillum cavolei]|nr:hypothetical protein [Sulfurospirillum cavolei]